MNKMENTTALADTTTLPDDYYYDYTEDYSYEDTEDLDLLPLRRLLPAVVLVSVVVIMAVFGNLLVLWSYIRDPGLRTVSNLYILNLAVCDFLIGSVSMPFYLIQTVYELVWPFGTAFCKIYLVVDYTMCSVSVLLVILISQDQLLMLRKGAIYSTSETKLKAYLKIAAAWFFGFLIYGPAIVGWDYWVGYSSLEPGECDVEFWSDHTYTFTTAVLEFFFPCLVLIVLNGAVYWEIRKRTRVVAAGIGSRLPVSREGSVGSASQSSLAAGDKSVNVKGAAANMKGAAANVKGAAAKVKNAMSSVKTKGVKNTGSLSGSATAGSGSRPKEITCADKKKKKNVGSDDDGKKPPGNFSSDNESDSTRESPVISDPEHSVESVYDNHVVQPKERRHSRDRLKFHGVNLDCARSQSDDAGYAHSRSDMVEYSRSRSDNAGYAHSGPDDAYSTHAGQNTLQETNTDARANYDEGNAVTQNKPERFYDEDGNRSPTFNHCACNNIFIVDRNASFKGGNGCGFMNRCYTETAHDSHNYFGPGENKGRTTKTDGVTSSVQGASGSFKRHLSFERHRSTPEERENDFNERADAIELDATKTQNGSGDQKSGDHKNAKKNVTLSGLKLSVARELQKAKAELGNVVHLSPQPPDYTGSSTDTLDDPAPRRKASQTPSNPFRFPATTEQTGTLCCACSKIKLQRSDSKKRRIRHSRAVRRDLKAAKALFTFVFAFLCTWAPYTIATVIIGFCEDCVNEELYQFFIWLLWFKAAVNPLLYAANNARFKANFAQILGRVCFCCKEKWRRLGVHKPDTTSVRHK